ncbi:SDR family oxidoreductase [Patulibacter sp. SYSU D01012]|uniref:SDR family oxidoreductase n=1 Tax=Patulibacter sp. SYSU D01012 TaxID=2817381 RepID=UPI001B309713|nr:SDR family oxidoreductase [Patulibacter sp. SYSU D01012]
MASTWLITGTSSGFGRHMTEQLLARGDRVAATLRRPSRLDDLRAQHADRLWVGRLDVTDTAAVRATVDAAWAAFGRIDAVVSNAGYGLFGAVEEMTDEQIERQLDTNVLGSIQMVRAALPHLRAQGGGRILQVASLGGHHAFPGLALYNATKFAMVGFTEALRAEVAPFGIGVTVVEPGSARTAFAEGSAAYAPAMEAYAGTPADALREQVRALDGTTSPGDPARMAAAMIAAADAPEAPVRLILGSDATVMIERALRERLAHVEEQRESAAATDADGARGGEPSWA